MGTHIPQSDTVHVRACLRVHGCVFSCVCVPARVPMNMLVCGSLNSSRASGGLTCSLAANLRLTKLQPKKTEGDVPSAKE
jgi:hypothetical protein